MNVKKWQQGLKELHANFSATIFCFYIVVCLTLTES